MADGAEPWYSSDMKHTTKTVGLIAYDRVQALDLVGPMDVFASANSVAAADRPAYELIVIGIEAGPCRTESGLSFRPQCLLGEAPRLDTLIIPGGAGIRKAGPCEKVAAFLRGRAKNVRRIASVCTGIYALAKSGLLDGRRATTHWRWADDVARKYPAITMDADLIFVEDDGVFTSAGISAGIDLSLKFVEDDLGSETALAVARSLVVYLKRPGGQLQYSEPLRFQTRATDRFRDIATWMIGHLDEDLSSDVLSLHAHLSTRHFNRRFKSTFGMTPARFVERLRLDEARKRMLNDAEGLDQVAHSVGYASEDAFRRSFERRFGVNPSRYRARFRTTSSFAE
jgi:transcriptional regulator GlxA family with amidase domain